MKRVGLLVLALAWAAGTAAAPPAPAPAAVPAPAAGRGDPAIRVLVAAEEESVLSAQMAGRIAALNVPLGASFDRGQVLLRFDCDEQEARLKMAEAELYGAQSTYESKVKLHSMESLGELEVRQAAAAVEKFRAQILLYKTQLKMCSLHAPFAGRVSKLRAKAFESVAVGQPLLEVVNDRRLKLQLNLPSAWLGRLKPGAAFTVRLDETGQSYPARVRRVNGKVDAVSQSIEIEGEFRGNPPGLLPGMSGAALFDGA